MSLLTFCGTETGQTSSCLFCQNKGDHGRIPSSSPHCHTTAIVDLSEGVPSQLITAQCTKRWTSWRRNHWLQCILKCILFNFSSYFKQYYLTPHLSPCSLTHSFLFLKKKTQTFSDLLNVLTVEQLCLFKNLLTLKKFLNSWLCPILYQTLYHVAFYKSQLEL